MAQDYIDALPFKVCLNLALLVDFWEREAASEDSLAKPMAESVLAGLVDAPELRGPIDDLSLLEPHAELLERMMSAAVPLGTADDFYAAAVVPFRLSPFYETAAARRVGLFESSEGFATRMNVSTELLTLGKAMAAYEYILHHWLGIEAELQYPLRVTIPCEHGLERHFALHFDPRFVALSVSDDLEEPSREDLERLIAEPTNLDLWKEMLPPEKFAFEGLTIVTATDVTPHEAVSRLKNDLIAKDAMASPAKIDHLQSRLRTLLRRPGLKLGLIGFRHGHDLDAIQSAHAVGRSLLLCDETAPVCPNRSDSWYAQVLSGRDPVIVHDLEKATRSGYEEHLVNRGHRNLLICPLQVEDEVVGILELSSPNPGDLNAFNALLLVDVVPLFATAVARNLEELEDRVQAVIKAQYTAIHPSVEWRFREAALNRIETAERTGETPELEQIVFEDVYPLYGLADIRGSSTIRNSAIAADLSEQLALASGVINAAGVSRPLPALEEIGFRIAGYKDRLDSSLRSDEESAVLEFLRSDVEPLFGQLAGFAPEVEGRVDAYRSQMDPGLSVLYRRRRDFEQSVGLINDTVSRVLDEEEARAQGIFPHYFEKFKTDGVDYSIYVGRRASAARRIRSALPAQSANLAAHALVPHRLGVGPGPRPGSDPPRRHAARAGAGPTALDPFPGGREAVRCRRRLQHSLRDRQEEDRQGLGARDVRARDAAGQACRRLLHEPRGSGVPALPRVPPEPGLLRPRDRRAGSRGPAGHLRAQGPAGGHRTTLPGGDAGSVGARGS